MWFLRKQPDDGRWEEMNSEVVALTREQNLDKALSAGKDLFAYSKKAYGKKHGNTVTSLNNLGIIHTLRKEFDEAEAYLLAALQLSEKVNGRISKEVLIVNMNLARLYTAKATWINDSIGVYPTNKTAVN